MDVFRQRLEDEYDANVIITAPTVPYKSIILYRRLRILHSIFPSYLSTKGGHDQQSD